MAQIDEETQTKTKTSGLILMENAGLKAWLLLKRKIPRLFFNPLIFFIGPGNNGGDGLVMARQAIVENHPLVHIVLYKESKTTANQANLTIIKKLRHQPLYFPAEQAKIIEKITPSSTIVDALLGIGIRKKSDKPTTKIINLINKIKNKNDAVKIVSLDVPSGMSYEANLKTIVKADFTITFGMLKDVLFYPYYNPLVGKMYVLNPGFPSFILNKYQKNVLLNPRERLLRQELKKDDFKNSRGSIVILGGSKSYLGAPVLAGLASFKTGAGLVSLITRKKDYPIQAKKNNSLIVCPIKDFQHDFLKYDCLLIGPGLSKKEDQEINFFKERLVAQAGNLPPLVFDADGIHFFKLWQGTMKKLMEKKRNHLGEETRENSSENSSENSVVLTPHIGEMAALAGTSKMKIKQNPYYWGELLSEKFQSYIVLKTHVTFIFTPFKKTATLYHPNPSLGVGGSGDVLGGIIASLLGYYQKNHRLKAKAQLPQQNEQNDIVFEILKLAVSVHSLSGKLANRELISFSAEELIRFIPLAIKALNENKRK